MFFNNSPSWRINDFIIFSPQNRFYCDFVVIMEVKMKKFLVLFLVIFLFIFGCENKKSGKQNTGAQETATGAAMPNNEVSSQTITANVTKKSKIKVTFVELGSVRCIPCKMMQPIMQEVEEKYGDEVKVIFYDVWTQEGRPYAEKYGIRAIPTQVFLDENGKEFFRHVGFFPREELFEVLKNKGINIK